MEPDVRDDIQKDIVDTYLIADMLKCTLVIATGGGKALPLDEPVLTPSGWVLNGSLSVGDYVIDHKGNPVLITHVHPQGERPIYKITFEDNTHVNCDENHLWYVRRYDYKKWNNVTVKELLTKTLSSTRKDKRYNTVQTRFHYRVPLNEAVSFKINKSLPIDSYTLGVLLGDGSLYDNSVSVTLNTTQISINSLILPTTVTPKVYAVKNSICTTYGLSSPRGKSNPLLDQLRELGLSGHKSIEKFIPEIYKKASIEDRSKLLKGLLDSDGSISYPNRYDYSTSSYQLHKDMKDLLRGLGLFFSVSTKIPYYRDSSGNKIMCSKSYRFSIRLKKRFKSIKSIEFVKIGVTSCITVDSAVGLYLTRDYTVTHNSKITLDLIKKLTPSHIYILVNSTDLRDYSWKKEFMKFGYGSKLENFVTIVTYQYQSRHLRTPIELDEDSLVILDEVDYMGDTDVLSKIMPIFEGIRTIGLTGFITEAKKQWFIDNLPVLMTYTPEQAQNEGILNKLKFIFVKYNLSTNPDDVTVTYKKAGVDHTFTQSENSAYEYQHKKYISLIIEKDATQKNFANGDITYDNYEKKLGNLDYKIRYAVKERSELLLNSKSSVIMARKLIAYILKDESNKIIVFSKRTAQSEKVCSSDNMYNGTVSKEQAKKNFDAFNKGELRVLGTCSKINRGVNIDNLNVSVFETFYGSDTEAVQRFGRTMRLSPDKLGTIYILLPYYMREDANKKYSVQPTQQVKWANSMIRSTNITNSEVWDYRTGLGHKT